MIFGIISMAVMIRLLPFVELKKVLTLLKSDEDGRED
jgi:hypothetical protein